MSRWISGILRAAVWGASAVTIVSFLVVAFRRLVYPLELDCIEGVMMDHVVRLAHLQPIYVAPSLSFIPLAYMPMFATVSALPAMLFGPAFWEPRLVSLLSVLGLTAMILTVVRSETGSWTPALAGAGIYLLGFGLTGGCYDVARPDSLMLLFCFGGMVVLRYTESVRGAIAAALLLTLAFFTKQHAALFVVAAGAHLAFNDRRRFPAFAITALVGCVGGYLLLTGLLGSWFRFYTYEIPSGWSQVNRARILNYVSHGLLGSLAFLTIASIVSLAIPERPWRGRSGIWMWAGLGAVGTGFLATLDPYAYRHVMTPTMLTFSLLGPLSIHRVTTRLSAGADRLPAAGAVAALLLLLQFAPLTYPLKHQLPHDGADRAERAFIERVRALPGRVLMPYHGYYSSLAGKGSSLQIIALEDIMRSRGNRLVRRDPRFIDHLFAPLRSGPDRPAIVTDIPLEASGEPWEAIAPGYGLADSLGWLSNALRPVTGNQFAPSFVYLPRGNGAISARLK